MDNVTENLNASFGSLTDDNFTCNGRQLLLRPFVHSSIGYYSRRYVFPFQFVIGVSTNFLNFVILSSKGMRTKTNNFLAAMALADLLFFLVYFPLQLSSYQSFSLSLGYTEFYFRSHIPLVASINWFSTASIWLTVGVTLERVIAVRFPLHARYYWKKSRVILAILLIFTLAFAVNVYHYFVRSVAIVRSSKLRSACTYMFLVTDPNTHPNTALYVKASTYLHNLTALLIPLVLLIVFNGILLHFLRKNSNDLNSGKYLGDSRAAVGHQRQEFKVTCTVVIIILAFLVLNVPSGLVTSVELVLAGGYARMPVEFYEITELCNVLVCMGKMVNFFLYCFSSSSFRRRLRDWLCGGNKFFKKLARSRASILSSLSSSRSPRTSISYLPHNRCSIGTPSRSPASANGCDSMRSNLSLSDKRNSLQMSMIAATAVKPRLSLQTTESPIAASKGQTTPLSADHIKLLQHQSNVRLNENGTCQTCLVAANGSAGGGGSYPQRQNYFPLTADNGSSSPSEDKHLLAAIDSSKENLTLL